MLLTSKPYQTHTIKLSTHLNALSNVIIKSLFNKECHAKTSLAVPSEAIVEVLNRVLRDVTKDHVRTSTGLF